MFLFNFLTQTLSLPHLLFTASCLRRLVPSRFPQSAAHPSVEPNGNVALSSNEGPSIGIGSKLARQAPVAVVLGNNANTPSIVSSKSGGGGAQATTSATVLALTRENGFTDAALDNTVKNTSYGNGSAVVAADAYSHPPSSHIKSPRTALPLLPQALPSPLQQKRTPRLAAATAAIYGTESEVVNRVASVSGEQRLAADEVLLDLDEMRVNPPYVNLYPSTGSYTPLPHWHNLASCHAPGSLMCFFRLSGTSATFLAS